MKMLFDSYEPNGGSTPVETCIVVGQGFARWATISIKGTSRILFSNPGNSVSQGRCQTED